MERTKDKDVLRVLRSQRPSVTVAELGRVVVSIRDERSRRAGVRLEIGLRNGRSA